MFGLSAQQKEKIKKLATIVDIFLEQNFDKEKLMALDGKEIIQIIESVELVLFGEEISLIDPSLKTMEDFYNKIFLKSDDVSEELIRESIKADNIRIIESLLFLHNLLKNFWEEFKATIFSDHVREMMVSSFKLRFFEEIKIELSCDYYIHFRLNALDGIRSLQNLIEGTPVFLFRICKDDACGKCFVLTTGHKREYCNRKCAARHNQRKIREADPEGYKQYHRDYYRKKVLGSD